MLVAMKHNCKKFVLDIRKFQLRIIGNKWLLHSLLEIYRQDERKFCNFLFHVGIRVMQKFSNSAFEGRVVRTNCNTVEMIEHKTAIRCETTGLASENV
ncbi:hypothetical protein ATCV1_z718L [Acanthocystis turfacea chlorella virus 1]|uniref:Uncharacterized protein z718L n=1 Tax=Chlorovirus heliozoae TaxID=322019 RepID=A7K9X8_9PHYC|nr:hypothetical protein ATCV1_z718L [Acanthocystis turfacea chlorella virus 1]ABT16852.1 hypothetical protein ATCV1_z718L [Acanthocystis turfacea chlorella virus 1]